MELAIAAVFFVILAMIVVHLLTTKEPQEEHVVRGSAPFNLPEQPLDVGSVLGRKRHEVHSALGQPDSTNGATDTYKVGPLVDVHFGGDVADGLVVTWPQAAQHTRAMRRWMHLPADGALRIGDHRYLVSLFVGDDDRIAIEQEGHASAVRGVTKASYGAAPTSNLPHAEDLVRAFPHMPDSTRTTCKLRHDRRGPSLTCSGYDAQVSYDVNVDQQPTALTVIDTANVHSEDECRDLLQRNQSDLTPGRTIDTPYEKTRYFTALGVDAAYTWAPIQGFRTTTSCSVVTCLKMEGRRTPCSPP
jgi:hypothetical protein